MERRGIPYEIYFTTSAGDAAYIARMISETLGREPLNIFVIGGDGTLNEVLNGLHHLPNIHVGFIPTDRSEGCAHALRMSKSPVKVAGAAAETGGAPGTIRIDAMDYGVLTCENGEIIRRFAGSSGMGFNAAVCRRLGQGLLGNTDSFRKPGKPAAFRDKMAELLKYRPARGYILLDGERRIEFNNLMLVSVHIHPYDGRHKLGGYADPKDGMLEICAVNCKSRMKLFTILLKSRFRGLPSSSKVRLFQCREAHIHFDRASAVHTDGESIAPQTDIDIRCVRQQLNVIR